MVTGPAGDVGVDVPILLEPAGGARGDERFERAKDGGATDPRRVLAQPLVELLGRGLAPACGERIRHVESLARDPFAGGAQPIRGRLGAQCAPTAPAKTEKE